MNAITLGNPNLFVKGMVEVVITDPETGNIIGYDNVASESAVNTSVNMGEITGGFGNPLLMNIPDTTRISGSLTSQAFSLQQRALMTGGTISSNGVIPYCETVTATTGGVVKPTRTMAKSYGQDASDPNYWCYVREHGASTFEGDPRTATLSNAGFNGYTVGAQYDLLYYTQWQSAEVLPLPTSFVPTVATVRLKYGVYAKKNNSISNGTLQGYLYFVVPRAQFTGDAGIAANQTTNSTTNYDWTAITTDNNVMDCNMCGPAGSDYAYYIYVPCGSEYQNIQDIVVIGGGVTFNESTSEVGTVIKLPIALVLKNSTIITNPDMDYSLFDSVYDESGKNYFNVDANSDVSALEVTMSEKPSNEGAFSYILKLDIPDVGLFETMFTVEFLYN